MKKLLALSLLLFAAPFVVGGCEDDNNPVTDHAPAAPQGVYTVTGDGWVDVHWNGVYENDVAEYIVWRSLSATTGYQEIARVDAEDNPNLDLLLYHYMDDGVVNGTTYYYAVSSVDGGGHSSDLSAENAYDTPRPEGQVTLFPIDLDSSLAGFNFEAEARVPYNSILADVYVDRVDNIKYLNAVNGADIQDMGYTSGFDDISVAPATGWSAAGYVEIVVGHTYVVVTAENKFAKVRVTQISLSGAVSFDWGFQTVANNPELVASLQRPVHGPNYLKKQSASVSQQ